MKSKIIIAMLVLSACFNATASEATTNLPPTIERKVVAQALRNSADRLKLTAVIMGARTFAPDGTVRITPDPIGMAKAEALLQAADIAEKLGFLEEGLPVATQQAVELKAEKEAVALRNEDSTLLN